MIRRLIAAALAIAMPASAQTAPTWQVDSVKPSDADPLVKAFDEPSIAINDPALPPDAPLAVFMPGSNGKPANLSVIMGAMVRQGYRVIGLEYNDSPSVNQPCATDPDPNCVATFRALRAFGEGSFATYPNPPAEGIVQRLTALLKKLDALHPGAGWGRYLDGDAPRWDRIVLSGLSQGAGMAAFIAKRVKVRRVVLFSSPWDFTGADRRPAPWLSLPSATPMDRWQAAYHQREATVPLIVAAYAALEIPATNVHVLTLDLPAGVPAGGPNPFHPIGIRDARYGDTWRVMFGNGAEATR